MFSCLPHGSKCLSVVVWCASKIRLGCCTIGKPYLEIKVFLFLINNELNVATVELLILGGFSNFLSTCRICSSWLSVTSGMVKTETRPFASPLKRTFRRRPSPLTTILQRTAGGQGKTCTIIYTVIIISLTHCMCIFQKKKKKREIK